MLNRVKINLQDGQVAANVTLQSHINLNPTLIAAEGTRLLRDQRAREDPAGACDEEASRSPRGKRVPAVEINLQKIRAIPI
ncbi:hypothetical protein [Heyndrickxia acidicola]|uniref:Uncharacterized protein n=1 Tax=Heyndrickxia acidicola TaxID=209389 RepID=A0ABU6MGK1_9BACI|nr:hypothetical protein [Heyndrickxia acidicola]MED1203809.1 hypothetical protein [Heyndrickxia acidicola]